MFSPGLRSRFRNEYQLLLFPALLVLLVKSFDHTGTICDEGYFRCHSGKCISSSFVCNGNIDCGHNDTSDEQSCHLLSTPANIPCKSGEFQCNDKLCIPGLWVCDGEFDCIEGSDETLGCETFVCDGFKCHSGGCLSKEWECDGVRDCPDNSDENHCAKRILNSDECSIHEKNFLCHDYAKCINLAEVCNNHADCDDGSDEGGLCINESKAHYCANHTCPINQGCIILPQGPECAELCLRGYHYFNGSCSDIDECSVFGQCDHICQNTIGGYNCSCIYGYTFDVERKLCKAEGSEGVLFFTSNEEIRGYYLDSEVYFRVVDKLPHATGVAYDGNHVYWTTIAEEEEAIVKASENGENQKIIVTSGIGKPEDLAIDWVTRNLYFTDSKLKYIGVCSNDGYYCLVLHDKDVEKPRAIVLHSSEGIMYWSDWGTEPAIMRSGMDGSNANKFITRNVHWPNGLSIDYGTNRLYWVDGKEAKIECIKLDGTDRRIVPSSAVKHPFSIEVFEDRIYWSDWESDQITSCNKFTGKDCHTLVKEKEHKIYGIHIYHSSMIGGVVNPCYDVHCSDLCLLAPKNIHNELQYSCACPYHKKLGQDHHTCVNDQTLEAVIVSSGQYLIQVEHKKFGGFITETAKVTAMRKIGALTYDSHSDKIILSDLVRRKIFTFDWKSKESTILIEQNIGKVVGMDMDYYENNLYWIDDEKKTIEVMNLQNKHRLILLRDLNEGLNDIALVLEHGFMFVAITTFEGAHIDKISMDGRLTSRVHVVENNLIGPLSLYFDTTLDQLFWSDQMAGEISSTDIDGMGRHIFKDGHSSPIDIACTDQELFWLSYGNRKLFWSNKYDASFTKSFDLDMVEELGDMNIITLNKHTKPGIGHACNSIGNCSHLCLLSQHSGVCACPDGMELEFDKKTCKKQIICKEDQYKCTSGECIAKSLQCNGRPDCVFGDDEIYCSKICPSNKFACLDGSSCIDHTAKCDFKADCADASDEKYCESSRNCSLYEFHCRSGECVSKVAQCDGTMDCRDGSDENNCTASTCKNDEFRCNTGNCIPANWQCDNQIDCSDGSDEGSKCSTPAACSGEQFVCENGHCISNVLVCNHEDDCEDSSDEKYCYFPKPKQISGSNNNKEELTHDCQYLCPSDLKICLPVSAKCNGTSECPDGEDESFCSKCSEQEFMCSSSKICLPKSWVCDNISDCEDHSDEMHCFNGTLNIQHLFNLQCDGFLCKDGKTCIPFHKLCDSHPDCIDESDEKGLCGKGCEHAACHHKCQETPMGHKCECLSGFILGGDGRTCIDVNECEKISSCSQYCLNTVGSFRCSCLDSSYQLRADKVRCKAKGSEMKYYYATKKEIKYKSQSLQETVVIFQSKRDMDIKGMDFDMNKDIVFWTSEMSGYLYRMFIKSKNITHITNLIRPTKMSYDWITGNIYVLENFKVIRVCNFDAKICSAIFTAKSDINIGGLTLDPNSRIMFWSENKWLMGQNPNSTLMKASMNSEKPSLVLSIDFSPLTDMIIDQFHKVIYWSNPAKNVIERCNYDGNDRSVVLHSEYPIRELVLFEDYLFWVNDQKHSHDIEQESEGTITKYGLYGSVFMTHESLRLIPRSSQNGIRAFRISQSTLQYQGKNYCDRISCDYLCISVENDAICYCEDGLIVKPGEQCFNYTGIHFRVINAGSSGDENTLLKWFFWIGGFLGAAVLGYASYFVIVHYFKKHKGSPQINVFFQIGRSETQNDQTTQIHQFENPTYREETSELKFMVKNEIDLNPTV